MATCSIEGCWKQSIARTWCHAHYKKWQLHGDPLHGRSYERGRGDGTITFSGYVAVMSGGKKKQQHVAVAESVIGKQLPAGAIVHHVDGNRQNNAPSNLVVCPDQAYHQLIHLRQRALDACGNPAFRKCIHCRTFDDPAAMTRRGNNKDGHQHYHKKCRAKYVHERTHREHHV